VIEIHQPNQSPQRIGERLQAEIKRQQQWEISPASPTSLRISSQQAQITHIGLILDAATQKSQPRTHLPGKFAQLPLISHGKVQRFLLKVYNFLFKEQRTAQMATIQALRESTKLHQQLLEQTQILESFQQDLQKALSPRLEAIDQQLVTIEQRLGLTEQRLGLTERQLGQLQLPETGIVQLDQLGQISQISDRLTHVETSLQTMQTQYGDYDQRLRHLQSHISQQRRLIQALPTQHLEPQIAPLATGAIVPDREPLDGFYSAFEEEFRGSQTIIRDRLKIYLPLIADMTFPRTAPILDLGCGRGEWLDLLQAAGYKTLGLDINAAMLEQCQTRGLKVVQGDAYSYLRSLPDDSLGGISGFHIVEHLPFEQLVGLIAEAFRVVQPGGFVLFETPNPQNVLVGSFSFYLDPTHRNPIPMEVMRFLLRYSGFDQVIPIWANASDLPHVVEDSELAKRFNALFYGFMDYAVIGLKA
jgi:SAM-dependent methyltransferase